MEVQGMNIGTGSTPQPPVPEVGGGKGEEFSVHKALLNAKSAAKAPADAKAAQADEEGNNQSPKEVAQVVEGMNTVLQQSGNHIRFMQHHDSGRMMVEIVDDRTSEVLRTIPNKELLDLAARIGDMVGVLVDHKT